MKRILIFNDGLEQGGTEVLLLDILNHLVKEKCTVSLLLPQPSDKNVLLASIPGEVNLLYLYTDTVSYMSRKIQENIMIFTPSVFRKLKGLKSEDYDVFICFKESFYARIFSDVSALNVLWIHNILFRPQYEAHSLKEKLSVWLNKKQIKTTRKSYLRYDKVVCVSDACRDLYMDIVCDNKRPAQKIEVLYNALDLTKIESKSKASAIDLPQGRTNFILVTRNSPDKRVDRFIDSVAQLHSEGYDFHSYLIGDGLKTEDMQADLVRKGISDSVTLLGRVDNPYPYILQANWLLCVSERESFSLTLLEAMALHTPVIATDCGGPRTILDGGKYGILVENSREGVYQGMKQVMDDPTLSVRYSSGLDATLNRFNYAGWLERINDILGLSS